MLRIEVVGNQSFDCFGDVDQVFFVVESVLIVDEVFENVVREGWCILIVFGFWVDWYDILMCYE